MEPWVISPNGRSTSRTMADQLEIIIGGDYDYWSHPIKINGKYIDPVSIERITNNRGGRRPLHKIIVKGLGFGKHQLQLMDQFVIVFYVNPLY